MKKIQEWFKYPERQVLFVFGLIYSDGMANFMLRVLVTFLTAVWKVKLKHAVAIINIQGGASGIMGIPVASLMDSYLGQYWTLFIANGLYCLALGLLAVSVPRYFDGGVGETCLSGQNVCYQKLQSSPFYWALFFIVLAKAGQNICLQAVFTEKLTDVKFPKVQGPKKQICCFFIFPITRRESFRNHMTWAWNIFSFAGVLTAVFAFSMLHVHWHTRFMVSACVMAGGIVLLLVGYSFYSPARIRESPIPTMIRVTLAAVLNRGSPDANGQHGRNGHLIRWLNTDVVASEPSSSTSADRRINCTMDELDQTKLLLGMVPISATFFLYGVVKSNSDTFFVEQGRAMKRDYIPSFKVPVQTFFYIAGAASYVAKNLYRITLETRIRRMNGRYSDAVKIGLGIVAGLFCCSVASLVEERRLRDLKDHGLLNQPDAVANLSVFWLTPQFVLIGIMDGLAFDGMKDFFTRHVPGSMTRYGIVFTNAVIGCGKIVSVGFVFVLDKVVVTVEGDDHTWFADSVNGGHLDYFFRSVVVVSTLNLLLFAYVASFYPYQEAATPMDDDEEEPEEQV